MTGKGPAGLLPIGRLTHLAGGLTRNLMEKFPVRANLLREAVRFVPALGLAYLNNPKVACTSIKLTLWQRSDEVTGKHTYAGGSAHNLKLGPWRNLLRRNPAKVQSAAFFTVVRDPYARLLSAYLNKIAQPQENVVKWCERRIGGVPKSFPDFINRIVEVPELERDRHFRPQWINILWPYIRFDFVGRMEDMDEVERFLAGQGMTLVQWKRNSTGASAKLADHYNDATRRLVSEAYADDIKLWRGELPPTEKTTISDLLVEFAERRKWRDEVRRAQ